MRNSKMETPLDLAALYGRLEVVKLLLTAHPNLLSCSTRSHTPLHLAARNGHRAVVEVLLAASMDINYEVRSRPNPLSLCGMSPPDHPNSSPSQPPCPSAVSPLGPDLDVVMVCRISDCRLFTGPSCDVLSSSV